jgi:hypothetical protein
MKYMWITEEFPYLVRALRVLTTFVTHFYDVAVRLSLSLILYGVCVR